MATRTQLAFSVFVLGAISLVVTGEVAGRQRAFSYNPPNGFVPDQATAVRIAEAVWIPIWGEEHILAEKPFVATLNGDVWTVRGTLKAGFGGVAEAEISKRDGRILRVVHGQ
jgi:hypothetical protein